MTETFGSTCHGAGRALARGTAKKAFQDIDIISHLRSLGVSVRVPDLVKFDGKKGEGKNEKSDYQIINERLLDEAPSAYKDVDEVVNICKA